MTSRARVAAGVMFLIHLISVKRAPPGGGSDRGGEGGLGVRSFYTLSTLPILPLFTGCKLKAKSETFPHWILVLLA